MKNNIRLKWLLLLSVFIITGMHTYSQYLKYTGYLRDCSCDLLSGQTVSLTVSIIHGTPAGETVYTYIFDDINVTVGIYTIGFGLSIPENFPLQDEYFIKIESGDSPPNSPPVVQQLLLYSFSQSNVQVIAHPAPQCNQQHQGIVRYFNNGAIIQVCDGSEWKNICCGDNCDWQPDCPDYQPCQGVTTAEQVYNTVTKTYNAVEIGCQCWLQNNLDIGSMVLGATDQSDNTSIEKYCYNNDESNCATDGGLYQWNEMMQYTTVEGTQGICSVGWHIPTQDEFAQLIDYVENNYDGNTAENLLASGECTGNGSSHFDALLAGYRTNLSDFLMINNFSLFWTSTISGIDIKPSYRINCSGTPAINLFWWQISSGLSVRCIKDQCGSIIIEGSNYNNKIAVGNSTGIMKIKGEYIINVVKWQRSYNYSEFFDISETVGQNLYVFEQIPTVTGIFQYRAVINSAYCTEEYTNSLVLIVE
ncbi:MAG: hypothetical protein HY738_10050 [Bacteroidia bacterium]|nr:hypothetical protein [Bacteroidia bacterium]